MKNLKLPKRGSKKEKKALRLARLIEDREMRDNYDGLPPPEGYNCRCIVQPILDNRTKGETS